MNFQEGHLNSKHLKDIRLDLSDGEMVKAFNAENGLSQSVLKLGKALRGQLKKGNGRRATAMSPCTVVEYMTGGRQS